jgi:hypothetical protein
LHPRPAIEERTNNPPWKVEKNGFHFYCASIGPLNGLIIKEDEDQFIYHGKPIKNGFHSYCAFIGPLDHPIIKEGEDQFICCEKSIKIGFTLIVLLSACLFIRS